MKVSVIIAAYNAEKYLAETLESIIHQTLDEYEVIVTNDGSTDSTLDILREYQQKFEHFHIIDKENGGPSEARNVALNIAQGEYIYFIDADDVAELDSLEKLYERAKSEEADLVIAKYDIFDRYNVQKIKNIDSIAEADVVERYDKTILWTFALWNKLFKREVIERYGMRFPAVSYSEDGVFVMGFVFKAEKITGLDHVVLHYRRMYDGVPESITASVSPKKIRDYIEAHHMILELTEQSFMSTYPEYDSFKYLKEDKPDVMSYFNEIIHKEIQILLNQFYSKFWTLDEDTIQLITGEIKLRMEDLSINGLSTIQNKHVDITLLNLPETYQQCLEQAQFSAVLYGTENCEENFMECLKSLAGQTMTGLKIFLPMEMKSLVEREDLMRGNMIFVQSDSESRFQHEILAQARTTYITFCDPKVSYANGAFKEAYKVLNKEQFDFVTELLYHQTHNEMQSVFLNKMAFDSFKKSYEFKEELYADYTLANKFIRTEFFKKLNLDQAQPLVAYVKELYKKGYFSFRNNKRVIYNDTEASFVDFVKTEETAEYLMDKIHKKVVSLNDEEFQQEPGVAFVKLIKLKRKNIKDKIFAKLVSFIRKMPVKDQVLFFTIRKNGKLEGNAEALYPYIAGKKLICAKMLPHRRLPQLMMYYKLVTSKVIVTDDYVRYLRHFPLRSEQRVIQLWHACGAFKKFGQHGTNLNKKTDIATHAQYNLVSVSGESVRTIYADAFNLNHQKVQALGSPRTDRFFDETYINGCREKILSKMPELEGKYVILYAPTFRDINNDRATFRPELDFDKLSKSLLPNQVFLICPHPLMTNSILEKNYSNIKEIREFSTNDMMFLSDMLITDYSSVIFEYALLRKPIAFFCYDLSTYNRGFYLNYPEDLPGEVYETESDLIEYLQKPEGHVISEKFQRFVENYMSACDGNSCQRIADIINAYLKGK